MPEIADSKNMKSLEKLLVRAGFSYPDSCRVTSLEELRTFHKQVGHPLVLKVCSDRIAHKTECGGVFTNLGTDETLEKAWLALRDRFPDETVLMAQEMITPGVELLLGIVQHESFGPMITVGPGGIFAELHRDVSMRCCPVTDADALDMLDQLKGRAILDGFRGGPVIRRQRLAATMAALSHLPDRIPNMVELDLNPVICNESGEYIVDVLLRESRTHSANSHRKNMRNVDKYFNPESIAVVGASRHESKGGYIILQNLRRLGFPGRLYPVNPESAEIQGMPCVSTLEDIPEIVDLAILIVPREKVHDMMSRGIQRGIRNFIICTAGFADGGEAGQSLEHALVELIDDGPATFLGPNSIGTINTHVSLATSITRLEPMDRGGVSIIAQSGVFASGYARMFSEKQSPHIAKIVCLGNKATLDETDFLSFLRDDNATNVIGCYLEGIARGEVFRETLDTITCRKPVVVLKAGNSTQAAEAIMSHTGALAIDRHIFAGVARQTGATRVHDTDEFLDTLVVFDMLPLPSGNRIGIASITGMGCVLCADFAPELGLVIPDLQTATLHHIRSVIPDWAPVRNPVDMWAGIERHGAATSFRTITESLLEQPDIDAVLLGFVVIRETEFDLRRVFDPLRCAHPDKPIIACSYGGTNEQHQHLQAELATLGIPLFVSPFRALRALSHLAAYAAHQRKVTVKL